MAARRLQPGTGRLTAGALANPQLAGARLRYTHRWDSDFYGYGEAVGFRSWEHGWGGEVSVGIGVDF